MTSGSCASPTSSGRRGESKAAWETSTPSVTPQRIGPTFSSRTMTATVWPVPAKRDAASATAVPMVGWPAKGSSRDCVKIRIFAEWTGFSGGSTKTVSDRLNSRAIRCIASPSRSAASWTTASGLPASFSSVKTSRTW
jgi:hypothetical protein